MERRGGGGSRITSGMIPFLAIHAANEYYKLQRKPPVTAGLLVANTLIYLRPGALDNLLPTLDEVWFNPYLILKNRDLKRFLLSPFYHVGEPHLVYNMMSLLWKGIQLESSRGSLEFASMVATLLGLSQGITLLLSKGLLLLFDNERSYFLEHAVGFSGVLFAMKVVLNAESDDYTSVYGLLVPARYAAWAELILIQMFVPSSSFLGHLGGILAGLIYLKWKGTYSGRDPLASFIRGVKDVVSWPLKFVWDFFRLRRGRISGRGNVGNHGDRAWRCPICTYDNSDWSNRCDMCGEERGNLGLSVHDRGEDLNLEELRRRRLQRFSR